MCPHGLVGVSLGGLGHRANMLSKPHLSWPSGAAHILGTTLPGTLTTLLLARHSVDYSWGGAADVGGDVINFPSVVTGIVVLFTECEQAAQSALPKHFLKL